MSVSVGRVPYRVGSPTFQVWDPIVSEVQMVCPDCGRKCFVALNGRTLLDPRNVRKIENKNQKQHDRVTHAALRHDCRR